jgi:group I intron endonuclease
MKSAIIYKATSRSTHKSYIGYTTVSLSKRKSHHKCRAITQLSNSHFHRAIRLYGFEDFEWEILYESWDKEHCLNLENTFIQIFDTEQNGYNSTEGGGKFPKLKGEKHPLYGRKRSIDERKKISKNHADVSGSKNPRSKTFIFIDPQGRAYEVTGSFKKFCLEHNLPLATMSAQLYGTTRQRYLGRTPKTGLAAGWSCYRK